MKCEVIIGIPTSADYLEDDFTEKAIEDLNDLYRHFIRFHGNNRQAITFVYDIDRYSCLLDCNRQRYMDDVEAFKKDIILCGGRDNPETRVLFTLLLDDDLEKKKIPLDDTKLEELFRSEFLCGKDYSLRREFADYLKKAKEYCGKAAEIDALLKTFA